MIKTKSDLKYFLECDRIALGKKMLKPAFWGDEIWKFQICMRKLSYYAHPCRRKGLGSIKSFILKSFYRLKYHKMSLKLGFSIPYWNIGPGLAIVHYGTIVISSGAAIGENCRIHTNVNIGANAGGTKAATIGNNVYIGPGAKIVGDVNIGDNSVIGANAVVVKDVPSSVTVGGVPTRIISENDSSKHLIKATEIVKKAGKKK